MATALNLWLDSAGGPGVADMLVAVHSATGCSQLGEIVWPRGTWLWAEMTDWFSFALNQLERDRAEA